MADGWTDKRGRTLINFLVYCSTGLCFIKSIDATSEIKTAKNLFKMFDEVLKWIGVANVVQVVTDNASNYKASALEHVGLLFQKASKISVFVYNHNPVLNWLKARDGWKEIVRPAATRFATHFEVLKSTYAHKKDLRALVVSDFFLLDASSKTEKGKKVSEIILDSQFWGDCLEVVKVVVPIIKLLKFVDSDAKPSLPYVYEGMKMIVKGIKDIYNDKESLYKQYVDIVNTRWDKHLKGDLHKAAYYLNPVLVYKHKESAGEVMKTSILNLLEKPAICSDPMQALRELRLYEDAKGSFGRDLAIKGRSQFHPGN
ncbi:hypothetical protein LINPERPRIM_LOCUS39324 [Linum perenne]